MRRIKFNGTLILREKSEGRESCEWMDKMIRDADPQEILEMYFQLTECQEQICSLVHGIDFDNIEEVTEEEA